MAPPPPALPPTCDLLSRVADFLPKIKSANKNLSEHTEKIDLVKDEDETASDDDKPMIEMNLALGDIGDAADELEGDGGDEQETKPSSRDLDNVNVDTEAEPDALERLLLLKRKAGDDEIGNKIGKKPLIQEMD